MLIYYHYAVISVPSDGRSRCVFIHLARRAERENNVEEMHRRLMADYKRWQIYHIHL